MPDDAQSQAGAVDFIEYHKPGLTDGDYEITVTQVVRSNGLETNDQRIPNATFSAIRNFSVAGERFALKPTDIHSVFPPEGNLGQHSNVLPHVILNRSTLPWERRAEEAVVGKKEELSNLPWLALLLFDEADKPQPKLALVTLAGSSKYTIKTSDHSGDAAKFPLFIKETGQQEGDLVTVIDVERNLLEEIMPTTEELPFLVHVRQGTDPEEDQKGEELAVIISNRLPQVGKTSTAHLVSIEGRYKNVSDQTYEFNFQNAGPSDPIRLVSLKSWTFTCEEGARAFKSILLKLNEGGNPLSTLRLPPSAHAAGDATAEKFLSGGYVLVPHDLRHGDRTASWYHGPLVPGAHTAAEINLPVRTADELVRYDPGLGMFDVSYAAAWELGRLLSLQNKSFSTSLYQWKRLHAQQLSQVEQRVTHLPFQKAATTDTPAPPQAISSWFERLRQLEGVPFNYLVPDERMLPVESIRFFQVDDAWVGCLLDGAFSIGRVTTSDRERDKLHGEDSPAVSRSTLVTGFLMRSAVVAGWPALQGDAYSDAKGNKPLLALRMARLSSNVLMCLFSPDPSRPEKDDMKRVEIHQKPETLHFGLDIHTEKETPSSGFYKNLRDPNTGAQLVFADQSKDNVEVDEPFWRTGSAGTLHIARLAKAISDKLGQQKPAFSPPLAKFTSAQFALQMVEGVEKVVFVAEPGITQAKR